MGRIWLPGGGGGGASSDDCTLMRAAVPAGMKAVTADSDDEAMEGTLNPDTTLADSQALSGQTFLKWNPQTKLFERHTGSMANRGAVNQSLAINGSYTIPAGFHNGSGKVTQDIPTKGAQTYTPGTANQTIAAGQYLTGPQTIKGDPNLIPANIKKGVSIMGIIGSWEGYATSPLYLFNNGTLGNSQKGITSTQGDCIISGSNIILNNDPYAGRFNIFRFNDKVDLTSYKYLKALCRMSVTAPQSTYMILFIHTDANVSSAGTSNSYASVTVRYTSNGTAIIDISSFNGFYYVYFLSYTTYSNDRVYVNQVYLSMT